MNAEHPNMDLVETQVINTEIKKNEDLERTVFIMKRVVEKLQAENKRLLSGRRPISERAVSELMTTIVSDKKV